MQRKNFQRGNLTFSYLDTEGEKPLLVALHGHMMEGATFLPLMQILQSDYRVVALDQRGHGFSDHAASYTRDDYLCDIEVLLQTLNGNMPAILLGHSLGGVNAYQFAARHPDLVQALIIEDIGAVVNDDLSFCLPWSGVFKTKKDLVACIGSNMAPYLAPSLRQTAQGWKLAFEPAEMVQSQNGLNGDHWQDWLATSCPALLLHGTQSPVLSGVMSEDMVRRRIRTQLQGLPGGHVLHQDDFPGYVEAVQHFLAGLPAEQA